MPVTAVLDLGRGSTLCPLVWIWSPNKQEPGFHIPPSCPGASMWRGGVTMNDAHVHAKSTIQFKDPFHKNVL
jgi:hypothetical protein